MLIPYGFGCFLTRFVLIWVPFCVDFFLSVIWFPAQLIGFHFPGLNYGSSEFPHGIINVWAVKLRAGILRMAVFHAFIYLIKSGESKGMWYNKPGTFTAATSFWYDPSLACQRPALCFPHGVPLPAANICINVLIHFSKTFIHIAYNTAKQEWKRFTHFPHHHHHRRISKDHLFINMFWCALYSIPKGSSCAERLKGQETYV